VTGNEYIFGPRGKADQFARDKGWRTEGRASWLKPDGTCVHYLAFEEQLAGIREGERVYVLGKLSSKCATALKKLGAIVVRAREGTG